MQRDQEETGVAGQLALGPARDDEGRTAVRALGGRRILLPIVLLCGLVCFPGAAARSGSHAASKPDIVLILTDDQRWDTLWAMPQVRHLLAAHGITFTHGYVVNPLCCPSRTSILTGEYSHSTGVYTNGPPHGGFPAFHDASTVATWLTDAGYSTALMGKYLNRYSSKEVGTYIPPGWKRWVAISRMPHGGGAYFDYQLNIDGRLHNYGDSQRAYSTDLLARQAVSFIRSTSRPLFLYFAPSAPHYPAIPAAPYRDAFSGLERWRPPSYNEADVADKPQWLQAVPRLDGVARAQVDKFRLKQYRTLVSVDDAVRDIVEALRQTGRLHNTLIVFASDNGFQWGEHRWTSKVVPYEESVRVPMVVRYDPLTAAARRDRHLVLNIDLAPTFADLAGTSAPGAEGQSMVPLLQQPDAPWRGRFLIEHVGAPVPTYCAAHTSRWVYVKYSTGEEELYSLRADPYQLQNLAGDPAYEHILSLMRVRLAGMCVPPPPGLTP
jgi:arylsulfatase A-like enzyme